MEIKSTFLEEINELNDKWEDLFYNSNWNKDAYKLFVRHISYAVNLWYWKVEKWNLYISKNILVVDFDLEKIIESKYWEIIKILELTQLK